MDTMGLQFELQGQWKSVVTFSSKQLSPSGHESLV